MLYFHSDHYHSHALIDILSVFIEAVPLFIDVLTVDIDIFIVFIDIFSVFIDIFSVCIDYNLAVTSVLQWSAGHPAKSIYRKH